MQAIFAQLRSFSVLLGLSAFSVEDLLRALAYSSVRPQARPRKRSPGRARVRVRACVRVRRTPQTSQWCPRCVCCLCLNRASSFSFSCAWLFLFCGQAGKRGCAFDYSVHSLLLEEVHIAVAKVLNAALLARAMKDDSGASQRPHVPSPLS